MQTVHSFAVDLTAARGQRAGRRRQPARHGAACCSVPGLAAELQQVYAAQAAGTVIAQTPAAAAPNRRARPCC
ncbi:MAG: hypothetical protein U1F11_15050 [Steroidobacteraceae bacterium]